MSLEHFDDRRKDSAEANTTLECDITEPILAWAAYEQLCLYAKQHGLSAESVTVTIRIEAKGKPSAENLKSLTEHLRRLGAGRVITKEPTFYPDTPKPQPRNGL